MSTPKTKPAVQLVLGSQAITFPLTVTVTKLDGTEAAFTLTCKAMRKTAWSKARDDYHAAMIRAATERAAAIPHTPAADAPEPDAAAHVAANGVHSMVTRGLQADADLVLQFATDWDLSDPLTPASLQALEDEFGGTLAHIINRFEVAIYQGRLGN